MVTANTHIKAVFMHVNYDVINNICLVSMRYAYSLIRDDRAKYPHHIAGFLLPCIKWYLDHQVAGDVATTCPPLLGIIEWQTISVTDGQGHYVQGYLYYLHAT